MQAHSRADMKVVALDAALTLEAATDVLPAGPSGPPSTPRTGLAKHCPESLEIKMPHSAEGRGWGGSRSGAGRPGAIEPLPIRAATEGLRWYAVAVHGPQWRDAVKAAAEGDRRPGFPPRPSFEVFHPTCRVMRRRVRQGRKVKVPVEMPMVPGYAFVQFDATDPTWGQLMSIAGIQAVLRGASGLPLPVHDVDLERLRKQAARDAKLNPDAMMPREKDTLATVVEGPFAGQTGTVLHCDGFVTAIYGITVLGRVLTMQFPWCDVRTDGDGLKTSE